VERDHGWWERHGPRLPASGIRAQTRRGAFGKSWWASRWIAALERLVDPGRLARGRTYARAGQVVSLEIGADGVSASVQGSRPTPYQVSITFRPLGDDAWQRVVDRMAAEAGVKVRVISGQEEARLIFEAVRASVVIDPPPALCLDLGGGSLEIAVGTRDILQWTGSFELGSSRLSGRFLRHDPPTQAERSRMAAHVLEVLRPLEPEIAALRPARCIAAGGTVKALARIAVAERLGGAPVTVGGTVLRLGRLGRMADALLTRDHDERLAMVGMNPDRADVLGAGALVLSSALTVFGFPELVVSGWGLREGIILQALGHIEPVRDTQSRPLRLGGIWTGRQRKARQAGSKRAAAGSR
jgi:hypothetical protein